MMNKWSMIAGVAATIICLSAEVQATPTTTLTITGGSGGYFAPGMYDYEVPITDVTVGGWTVDFSGSVLGLTGSMSQQLSVTAQHNGSAVENLTIMWTFGNYDAFAGSYSESVGGTIDSSITLAKFSVLVNGGTLSGFPQSFTAPGGFNGDVNDIVNAAAGSSVTFQIDLSANGSGGPTTFSQTFSTPDVAVPDGGVTVLLLGAALSVLGLARKLQMA
jgi:hypothetical protein